jgi:hypothetical protein
MATTLATATVSPSAAGAGKRPAVHHPVTGDNAQLGNRIVHAYVAGFDVRALSQFDG